MTRDEQELKVMNILHAFQREFNMENTYENRPLERRAIKRKYTREIMSLLKQ